jgi:hypothetical protein
VIEEQAWPERHLDANIDIVAANDISSIRVQPIT